MDQGQRIPDGIGPDVIRFGSLATTEALQREPLSSLPDQVDSLRRLLMEARCTCSVRRIHEFGAGLWVDPALLSVHESTCLYKLILEASGHV